MSGEQGGWLWLVIDVLFVAAFAFALAYGLLRWRTRRTTGNDRQRDAATKHLYHESEAQADREAARRHG